MKTMLKSFSLIAVSIASVLLLSNEAAASVTLQPVGASTNMGEYIRSDVNGAVVFSASHVIDQSGLYPTYTSNVSDFDSYLALNPAADHGFGNAIWGASAGVQLGKH